MDWEMVADSPLLDTASLSAAVALIGTVLALFLMTVFIVVLLTPGRKQASYVDTVIELPPTHKPYPAFEDHSVSVLGREYLYKLKDHNSGGKQQRTENSSSCLQSTSNTACYRDSPYAELEPRQVHFTRRQYYL